MPKQKKTIWLYCIIAACLAPVLLIALFLAYAWAIEHLQAYNAGSLITQIENYRSSKGHLPETIAELGLPYKEEGPFYYVKKTETTYIVYFSEPFTVGESITYYSETHKWEGLD